jgi:hypothetical protein
MTHTDDSFISHNQKSLLIYDYRIVFPLIHLVMSSNVEYVYDSLLMTDNR